MSKSAKNPKVLFVANITIQNDDRTIGGATVLAQEILNYLQNRNDLEVVHLQIRHFWKPKFQILDYFILLFTFPFHLRNVKIVSFHGTRDLHWTIAPFLYIWARIFRKKIVYHFFGGYFYKRFDGFPKPIQFIIKKTILKSDYILFETKYLIQYFKESIVNQVIWFPNSRKKKPNITIDKDFNKKFVFITRVIPKKGTDLIIEISKSLPMDITIDVYGPIDTRYYLNTIFDNTNINYRGVIKPEEVIDVLSDYDVSLLPTYCKGEGYPGVLIESLAAGIPVITTNWRSLPEIITDKYNGLLIKPENAEDLKKAVLFFNKSNYQEFRNNALKSFKDFNSEYVFQKLTDIYLNCDDE